MTATPDSHKAADKPVKGKAHKEQSQPLAESTVESVAPLAARRAMVNPAALTPANVMALQRTVGNAAVQRILAGRGQPQTPSAPYGVRLSTGPVIQPKLTVGPVNDKYEQEADRVARQVVSATHTTPAADSAPERSVQRDEEDDVQMKPLADAVTPRVQRDDLDDEEELQMKAAPGTVGMEGGAIGGGLERAIRGDRGSGRPLPDGLRGKMEGGFGADFGNVRVHTGSQADALNRSLNARAFTSGSDIFFKRGEFKPGSSGGQELIAHELTHTVQQGATRLHRANRVVQRSQPGAIVQRFHVESAKATKKGSTPFISQGVQVGVDDDQDPVYDFAQQSSKGTASVRVSDDGKVAVEDTRQPKTFFAESSAVKVFNLQLTRTGSWYRLMQTGEKIKVNDDAGKVHTLNQTLPMNLRTHTSGPSMVTKQLCNLMAKEVTGAGSRGTLDARYNKGKKTTQVEKSGTTSNATAAFIAKLFAREIDKAKGGEKGEEEYTPEKVEDRLLKVKEEETPTVAKVAKEIGVNEYTPMPEIGEAYVTYSSGNYGAKGKWNYHWGGVIGTTGSDIITLENYARSGELQDVYDKAGKVVDFSPGLSQQAIDTRYFFKMYGVQKIKNEKGKVVGTQDRSFHSESVLTGDFVNPVTILKGKKGAEGEGQEIGDKVPIADEYVRDLKDSVGQNWKNIPVQKLEQNWAKLPTLVSRIADAFEQQKKLDPRFTDKLDKRKKSFLEEIKAVMPDLGGPGRKRKKLSREKMLPYLRQTMGIIDTYTTSFGISG